MTEAEKRAKKKYLAKGKRLTVDFYPTEADLIEHLEKQPQKQTYIKNLIREDIRQREQQCQYCKLWRTDNCLCIEEDPKANDCYGCFEK